MPSMRAAHQCPSSWMAIKTNTSAARWIPQLDAETMIATAKLQTLKVTPHQEVQPWPARSVREMLTFPLVGADALRSIDLARRVGGQLDCDCLVLADLEEGMEIRLPPEFVCGDVNEVGDGARAGGCLTEGELHPG